MRSFFLSATFALAIAAVPVAAEPVQATTKAAYSVEATSIGTLMDDPAAKAILARHLPAVVSNPQFEMARGMTLGDIAPMSGGLVTVDAMKAINNELKSAAPAPK